MPNNQVYNTFTIMANQTNKKSKEWVILFIIIGDEWMEHLIMLVLWILTLTDILIVFSEEYYSGATDYASPVDSYSNSYSNHSDSYR